MARIWLGFHFRDAMDDGYRLGHLIGTRVSRELQEPDTESREP